MGLRVVPIAPQELQELPDRDSPDVHETVVVDLEVARLRRALGMLHPLERRVVELRWGLGGREELSTRQVAAQLRMSVGRVFYLHKNALEHLRDAYGLGGAATDLHEAA